MKRRIASIGLAILLAVVGTVAVYAYVQHASARAVASTESAQVLIAQKAIPAGTSWSEVVRTKSVRAETLPAGSTPSNAVRATTGEVPTGEVATAAVAGGQVIVRPMFGARTAVTGALNIPAKKIAVAVSLPIGADVAGYVQSGSYVTVFATAKLKSMPSNQKTGAAIGDDGVVRTMTVLARTQVLAASAAAPTTVDGGAAKNTAAATTTTNVMVTLAVSQTEAQKLILSQQVGQLYLGLLSDTSQTKTDGGVLGASTFRPAPITIG